MNLDLTGLTQEQAKQRCEQWSAQQIAVIRPLFGKAWPQHAGWIEEAMRQFIRARLVEAGSRVK